MQLRGVMRYHVLVVERGFTIATRPGYNIRLRRPVGRFHLITRTRSDYFMTMLGKSHSEESKRKIGDSNRGKIRSDEINKQNSISHMGKVLSEETKQKMSDARKKQYKDPNFAEKHRLSLIGRVVTEETRNKIRISNINKKRSSETKLKMSDSAKLRWLDPEERKRTSEMQKLVCERPEYKEMLRNINLGKKHTLESRKKMGLKSKGKNNPRWNGGITPFRKQIHECFKMNIWRQLVFKRDNYKDWFSGCGGTILNPIEAHHVIRLETLLKKYNITTLEDAELCMELWDVSNGVTMLKQSHRAHHIMWGWKC